MSRFRSVVLWLFILFLGVALGAGVYESRIVLPLWLTPTGAGGYFWDADAARQANAGVNFWVYVTTVPLTLLTIASLVLAWRSHPALAALKALSVAEPRADRQPAELGSPRTLSPGRATP